MSNDLIEQKNWWKQNWKWLVPAGGIIVFSCTIFFSSGMNGVVTDFAQAYADKELYQVALEKAETDQRVTDLLGEIQPIDKMAILEGQVEYSNDNKTVNSSIRVNGANGKASMDISADRINNEWSYKKINIRIKKPIENKQTIEIVLAE